MEKKQLAFAFGVLVVLAALGAFLADDPREATQRVLYANGLILMIVSTAVGARKTCDGDGPCRVRPATRWPTPAMFRTVAALATAGWLTTSLLIGDIAWLTWLAAFAGLLAFGCLAVCLRWRYESLVPMVLSGFAFIAFTYAI